ncbi:helix-turn-helix domain-containing protein [Trichloromonas sp.]|uniref:helix-turn-helix domain-containing protein n=1 Tax=Trichloromonas sp. TaxID=3069249 RepID=UPI003D81A249
MEGRIKDIARGVKFGAKPILSKQELAELLRDFEAPGCSKTEIAEHYGISRSSVYRLYVVSRRSRSRSCSKRTSMHRARSGSPLTERWLTT